MGKTPLVATFSRLYVRFGLKRKFSLNPADNSARQIGLLTDRLDSDRSVFWMSFRFSVLHELERMLSGIITDVTGYRHSTKRFEIQITCENTPIVWTERIITE